jgi:hypothetical protein
MSRSILGSDIRLAPIAGPADTGVTRPLRVRMTRQQAQALEVVRLAIDAARKTGLTDEQILDAINFQIYPKRVSGDPEPKK